MSTYTPGPWFVDANYIVPANGGVAVCDLMAVDLSKHQEFFCGEETEANARLIAAAPDLLEAARQAEKVIDILWVSHHANRSDAALEQLRAAIAKATTPGKLRRSKSHA